MIEDVRMVVNYISLGDTCLVFLAFGMWIKAGRPMEVGKPGVRWLTIGVVGVLMYAVFLAIHLVLSLFLQDWFSIVMDALVLLWWWWVFFDGNGKFKKWRKRLKEKVAVIKGRLKVITMPSPVPA